jgi:hypothetical protein
VLGRAVAPIRQFVDQDQKFKTENGLAEPTHMDSRSGDARRLEARQMFEGGRTMLKLTTASLLAASFVLPALAQTPAPPSQTHSPAALNAPATHDTSGNPTGNGYNSPSARNTAMTDNGTLRASKVVGSSVYNDHDEKIGSIDDLVIGSDHSLHAVLSVGGFLGMGSKMVEVPFDKLEFGNTKGSSDNKVVLPGSSKQDLTSMPDFKYTNRS